MTFNNYNLYQKKYKGVPRNEKPKYNKNIDYSITKPPPLPKTQPRQSATQNSSHRAIARMPATA